MAGKAICTDPANTDVPNGYFRMSCPTFFYDDENPELGGNGEVTVEFAFDATPQQIKTAMSDAIIQYAAWAWPTMSLAAVDVIIPSYQRG